jgi:hypothetical protein
VPAIMAAVLDSLLHCRWLASLLLGKLVFLPVYNLAPIVHTIKPRGALAKVDDGQISSMAIFLFSRHLRYCWGRPIS